MGVKNLWKVLEPVRERVEVKSLRCKVLGIDLAVWVVQAENVVQGEYQGIYLRQLFFKVTHLLEHGIGVVVVTDGKAPILKAQTIADRLGVQLDRNYKIIQRRRFMKIMNECKEMLVSMGIPVLKGESEGEASAAKLQQDGRIDGVITTDGDAFLYGARTVYRNLLVTELYCDMYCMDRVEYELGLSRDDLIAFGILNGCDYNPQGVTGLGVNTVLSYIQDRDRVRSATSELISWVEQKNKIVEKYEQMLALKQHSHCSFCKHIGKKSDHQKFGCPICDNSLGSPCDKENTNPCMCPKHVAKKLLSSPHMICCAKLCQASIRRKMPVSEIVDEFKNYKSPLVNLQWSAPELDRFVYFMRDKLKWRTCAAAEKFAYVSALHLLSRNIFYNKPFPVTNNKLVKFVHILKERIKNKQPLYELEFQILNNDLKKLIEFDTIYVILDTEFVKLILESAVSEFENRSTTIRRKKKTFLPIYERYSKPKTPEPDPFKTILSPRKIKSKASLNNASRPKTSRGGRSRRTVKKSQTTNDVESVASSLGTLSLFSKTDEDSCSDEEFAPLAERLAMRNGSESSTTRSYPSKLSASSISSLSSSDEEGKRREVINISITPSPSPDDENDTQNSDVKNIEASNEEVSKVNTGSDHETSDKMGNEIAPTSPDKIAPYSPETEFVLEQNFIDDEYSDHDSNIQLLPHSFIEEYLDKSREDILGPVIPEEGEYEAEDSSLMDGEEVDNSYLDSSPEVVSREQATEGSINETSYSDNNDTSNVSSRRPSSSFHQLAFVTPLRPGESTADNIEPLDTKIDGKSSENDDPDCNSMAKAINSRDIGLENYSISGSVNDPNSFFISEQANLSAEFSEINPAELQFNSTFTTTVEETEKSNVDFECNEDGQRADNSSQFNDSLDLSMFAKEDAVFSPKAAVAKADQGELPITMESGLSVGNEKDLLQSDYNNNGIHSLLDDSLTDSQILSIPASNEAVSFDPSRHNIETPDMFTIPPPPVLKQIPLPDFVENNELLNTYPNILNDVPEKDTSQREALDPISERLSPPSPFMLSNEPTPPFSPIPPLMTGVSEIPDTSFLSSNVEEISPPAWKRKPLSSIQNQVSTPKTDMEDEIKAVSRPPLPDIHNSDEENFNLDVTGLLNTTLSDLK